ncbi:MAG: 50S ribosomal protein L1 [Candidatus Omnitrophica bacterium]|nr:50S ribosomal protein L1 [Candidatus Omnitrophota bacterium]MCM8807552.1 50S ribosomal protein L1 [Candidatus Omnitrophota bacterium]
MSKRYNALLEKVDRTKLYTLDEAITVLKDLHSAKFDETVNLSIKLGIDPKKLQQPVRGTVVLPHGTGRNVRVLVFASGENVKKAQEAGADYVGGSELVEKIKNGWLDFDYVIATPDMMKIVAPLGKILGPRGLMPNPKTGTVTENVDIVVKEAKRGKVDFKMDKDGNIHMGVGKISFPEKALKENILSALSAVLSVKPQGVKGTYIKTIHLSLTMSPSVKLNVQKVIQELKGSIV